MKYCIGALFMMVVCCLWVNFRYVPRLQQSEDALIQCHIELAVYKAREAENEIRDY